MVALYRKVRDERANEELENLDCTTTFSSSGNVEPNLLDISANREFLPIHDLPLPSQVEETEINNETGQLTKKLQKITLQNENKSKRKFLLLILIIIMIRDFGTGRGQGIIWRVSDLNMMLLWGQMVVDVRVNLADIIVSVEAKMYKIRDAKNLNEADMLWLLEHDDSDVDNVQTNLADSDDNED
ncbi:hypothetical protein FQA39_LY00574 [Lamprigera yunnana]|nr:hypothetical protein FQA39_LY00574 [Lamprigera yunnana]